MKRKYTPINDEWGNDSTPSSEDEWQDTASTFSRETGENIVIEFDDNAVYANGIRIGIRVKE